MMVTPKLLKEIYVDAVNVDFEYKPTVGTKAIIQNITIYNPENNDVNLTIKRNDKVAYVFVMSQKETVLIEDIRWNVDNSSSIKFSTNIISFGADKTINVFIDGVEIT
jgi:hypothetical protein